MFARIAAIAVALVLTTAGAVATSETARSASSETGPCVIAVWKSDPTIKAQRGNCPEVVHIPVVVEPTVEPTIEPTAEPTVEPTVTPTIEPTVEPTTPPVPVVMSGFFMDDTIRVFDRPGHTVPFHLLVVNQVTGQVIEDRDRTGADWTTVSNYVEIPASDVATNAPLYLVTVTVGGISYGYSITPSQYMSLGPNSGPARLTCETSLNGPNFAHQC